MTRLQTWAFCLVLTMPILGMQYATAADDAQMFVSKVNSQSSIATINNDVSATGEQQEEPIDQLFDLYKSARSNGMQDEADVLAKRIVDASIRSYGLDSKITAIALTNLAMLQTSNDDYVSASQNFVAAIEIVERVEDYLSPDLIVPLKGLGRAQLQAGNADTARIALTRALHLSHVNYGPHNYAQIETLYSIARLLHDGGMDKEAGKIEKRIAYLHTRNLALQSNNRRPTIGETG